MNSQFNFSVNLEWGINGIKKYFNTTDLFIIVDVLSFSTCVDIAENNGAGIIPFKWKNGRALEYAKSINSECASLHRSKTEYSLSPVSLLNIKAGTNLVLPSPNGSELSLSTGNKTTLCGCIRNAESIGQYAAETGKNITVIAAGEKWSDESLRLAIEDLIGAGAILCHLKNNLSPECKTAIAVFKKFENNLFQSIRDSVSGQELIDREYEEDIKLASNLNVSRCVPVLLNGIYTNILT